jgi:hypothetical protein
MRSASWNNVAYTDVAGRKGMLVEWKCGFKPRKNLVTNTPWASGYHTTASTMLQIFLRELYVFKHVVSTQLCTSGQVMVILYMYSALGNSLFTYKRCWQWCPRVSIQAWTRLILFANSFCRSACEMFFNYAVIVVFNSLSVLGRSRYAADFAAPHRSKCTATFRTNCIHTYIYIYIW